MISDAELLGGGLLVHYTGDHCINLQEISMKACAHDMIASCRLIIAGVLQSSVQLKCEANQTVPINDYWHMEFLLMIAISSYIQLKISSKIYCC